MSNIFKGATAEQDPRFADKAKKLMRTTKFPPIFETKVDMKRVHLKSLLPWITDQVTKLLGNDDEVVIGYIQGSLEKAKVDPKEMQLSLAGFLDKHTAGFMRELWVLLVSAQEMPGGVPREFVEKQEEALRVQKAAQLKIEAAVQATKQDFEAQVAAAEEKRRGDEGGSAVASSADATAGGEQPMEEGLPVGEALGGGDGRERRGVERERGRYEDSRYDDRRRDERCYDDRYKRRRHEDTYHRRDHYHERERRDYGRDYDHRERRERGYERRDPREYDRRDRDYDRRGYDPRGYDNRDRRDPDRDRDREYRLREEHRTRGEDEPQRGGNADCGEGGGRGGCGGDVRANRAKEEEVDAFGRDQRHDSGGGGGGGCNDDRHSSDDDGGSERRHGTKPTDDAHAEATVKDGGKQAAEEQ